jgi:hypothetical protein
MEDCEDIKLLLFFIINLLTYWRPRKVCYLKKNYLQQLQCQYTIFTAILVSPCTQSNGKSHKISTHLHGKKKGPKYTVYVEVTKFPEQIIQG